MSAVREDADAESFGRAQPHSLLAKAFHWGFIVVFAYGLVRQVDEVEELEDSAFLLEEIIFAILFLVVLLLRFIYMRTTRPTALSAETEPRISTLARIVHLAMYASLALLALTGLAIGGLFASNRIESTLFAAILWSHEAFYWTSLNLIGLHVIGALYHRRKRDGVWDAMVPVFSEQRPVEDSVESEVPRSPAP